MSNTIHEFMIAGSSGDEPFPPQQQMTMQPQAVPVIVELPPQDNTAVWVAGVAVPLIIAIIGWYLQHKWRENNPNTPMTIENIKKSREK